jgi:hypothetical protein
MVAAGPAAKLRLEDRVNRPAAIRDFSGVFIANSSRIMIGNNNFSGQQTGPSLALPTRTCPVLAGQLILQSVQIHRQVFGFDNTGNECVIIGADYAA